MLRQNLCFPTSQLMQKYSLRISDVKIRIAFAFCWKYEPGFSVLILPKSTPSEQWKLKQQLCYYCCKLKGFKWQSLTIATRHCLTVNRQAKRGMLNSNANAVIKTGIYMSSVTKWGFSFEEDVRKTDDVENMSKAKGMQTLINIIKQPISRE